MEDVDQVVHELAQSFARWLLHDQQPFQETLRRLVALGVNDDDALDQMYETLERVIEEGPTTILSM